MACFAPGPAGNSDAKPLVVEPLGRVGVAVDNQRRAQLPRSVGVNVLQVQALGGGVQLQRRAGLGRRPEYRLEVGFDGTAVTDQAGR